MNKLCADCSQRKKIEVACQEKLGLAQICHIKDTILNAFVNVFCSMNAIFTIFTGELKYQNKREPGS